ncbi:MAG TPA: hypothetical protein VID29_10755 [Solirubrobacteraceae bacterium]|jgi:hypothetical protein
MAQLSRPYQMVLAAMVLLAMVWFAVLHRPGAGGGSSSSNVPAAAAPPAAPATAKGPGSPSSVYHGSAPGVEGLTRAIAKAHGAVATSEQNAAALAHKSEQASAAGTPAATGTAPATHSSAAATANPAHGATHSGAAASGAKPTTAAHPTRAAKPTAAARPKPAAGRDTAGHAREALQAQLAGELKQGKVLLLLFWNPRSSDDVSVRNQLKAVAAKLKGRVAVHIALAGEVGRYGAVTRDVQVFGTPTLLVVGPHGLAGTVTGLVDAFGIEQAVSEARHASAKG